MELLHPNEYRFQMNITFRNVNDLSYHFICIETNFYGNCHNLIQKRSTKIQFDRIENSKKDAEKKQVVFVHNLK